MLFKNRYFPLLRLADEEMKLYRTELAQGEIASERVPVIPMSQIPKPVLAFLQTDSLSTGFYDVYLD